MMDKKLSGLCRSVMLLLSAQNILGSLGTTEMSEPHFALTMGGDGGSDFQGPWEVTSGSSWSLSRTSDLQCFRVLSSPRPAPGTALTRTHPSWTKTYTHRWRYPPLCLFPKFLLPGPLEEQPGFLDNADRCCRFYKDIIHHFDGKHEKWKICGINQLITTPYISLRRTSIG